MKTETDGLAIAKSGTKIHLSVVALAYFNGRDYNG